MNYRKINNLAGWTVFFTALTVYLLTLERTVSFWDCGEFLACANGLEVGHSPGAPFFMLIQRLFAIMAGGNKTQIALFINAESAIASAFTILFLFWTITHLARKIFCREVKPDRKQLWLIVGAGLTGALAYTFSDTFWFSAVEAEVYATSSMFTAFVFWAMLKWEAIADERHADRWLVLIAYMVGISVGVHLLNLLTIPALAMIYYFRRYKTTRRGIVAAFFIGCALLGFVQFGVIQYVPIFASRFDLLFVNSFGLPFDSGALTALILLFAVLIWLLIRAKKKGWYLVHTGTIAVMFILLGCSSYLVPMIRSRANTPVDMTNPDNVMSLVSYLQREQYLQQPLVYGQDYNTPVIGVDTKGNAYGQTKKDGKDYYEVIDKRLSYKYDPSRLRLFPRIWDNSDPSHVAYYKSYLGLTDDAIPTSADNISFFMGYQLNWMWWRYFMWNYAGRQNDFEGQGEARNGNWISGIGPIDRARLGNPDKMGKGYADNKARNELYFLPLILGLLGMIYHFNHRRKDAAVVLLLFFFTGIAIAVYLNMAAIQPRERDYAFAGSTYAFAIWIGLGVLMVYRLVQRFIKSPSAVYMTVLLCLLAVPALMAKEEWDDHDRSRKSLARASAWNTLQSCAPNAILFTVGDNDTYPLWYLQEVEGVRRDVRVIITELLGTDWYIDQLNYRVNDADAVPMVWKKEDYIGSHHNYVQYYHNPQVPQDKYLNLYDVCRFMNSTDPANTLRTTAGETENYLPSKKFFVQSPGKDELVRSGLLPAADTGITVNEMKFDFPKDAAYKNDLAVLNIVAAVAQQGWKRPVYFNGSFPGSENYDGMGDYMRMEGVVFRLLPWRYNRPANAQDRGSVNIDKSYDLLMHKYLWGGGDKTDVYFDEKNRVMFTAYRLYAAQLADALTAAGRKQDAVRVLDKIMHSITETSFPYDFSAYYMATAYYHAGAADKARSLSQKLVKNATDDISWIATLNDTKQEGEAGTARNDLGMINMLANAAQQAGDSVTANAYNATFQSAYGKVAPLVNVPQAQ